MPFMVIYSTSDGTSCFEQADAIDQAAMFVERLRNQDGIEEIHIYRMEELRFAFRPYYKVELGMPERAGTAPSPAAAGEAPTDPPAEDRLMPAVQDDVTPVDDGVLQPSAVDGDPAEANARRGLFGR